MFKSQKNIIPSYWSEVYWGNDFKKSIINNLQPLLKKIFGYYFIKLGDLSAEIDTSYCPIKKQICIGENNHFINIISDLKSLPLKTKSVDACLLINTLSWVKNVFYIVQEINRILINDGFLIITNFNPISLISIGKIMPKLKNYAPWNTSINNYFDTLYYLNLLNYKYIHHQFYKIKPKKFIFFKSTMFNNISLLNILVVQKRTNTNNSIPIKSLNKNTPLYLQTKKILNY